MQVNHTNILITGKPHVGKSTLLNEVITNVKNTCGFVTLELTEKGERSGFELVSSAGIRAVLASTKSESSIRVSRYGVELQAFNDFLSTLMQPKDGTLLYIDEIGQMELFSDMFKDMVRQYIESPNLFIGTLSSVYNDVFTENLRARNDVQILHMTLENRDEIKSAIQSLVALKT